MQISTISELKQKPIWVNWRLEDRNASKKAKVPINSKTGGNAMSNEPDTWSTFDIADKSKNKYNGIGFMFSELKKDYLLCGVDIDGTSEEDNPLSKEIAEFFKGTYIEASPSGTGLHIIFAIAKDFTYSDTYYKKNPHNKIECYLAGCTQRYFTYTGSGADLPILDMTEKFKAFLDKYMKRSDLKEQKPQLEKPKSTSTNIDVIEKARNAKNGSLFKALYDSGDISAYNNDDSSADLALCSILAFYMQGDSSAIDNAFRSSALMRDKWNRDDYRSSTINKAISSCKGNFYTKPRERTFKPTVEGADAEQKKQLITFDLFNNYLDEKRYVTRNNEITHNFDFDGFSGENPSHINNLIPIRLVSELKPMYSGVTKNIVYDFIYWRTANNPYNPILDLIENEIASGETGERESGWDGVDRIAEIYNIFGIAEKDSLSRTLIKKWLMQAYCGLHNNTDNPFSLDIVLVFQGGQGIGKTRFFEKLALIPNCFGEGITIDPSDKDSVKMATSVWIGELGEIGSTMKKDMDKVKAFLTKAKDEYRLPYAHEYVSYPRRTSFVGTVNDQEFLIDQTGNRRFATVPLKENLVIDYDTQIKPFNALQLWAQVAEIVANELATGKTYANCFRLTTEERSELSEHNSNFTKPLKGETEVTDILTSLHLEKGGFIQGEQWMSVTDFKAEHDALKNLDSRTIGKILKKLGYESKIIDKKNKTNHYLLPFKTRANNAQYY